MYLKDSNPAVELKVKVININPDQEAGEEEPYRKAIEECIEKNVLADYLRKKGSEVVNMLMSEYNYEDDIAEQREEAYEEGKKAGRELGKKEGEIMGTIQTCKDFHISTEEIIKKLMDNFSMTREKAEAYMKESYMK